MVAVGGNGVLYAHRSVVLRAKVSSGDEVDWTLDAPEARDGSWIESLRDELDGESTASNMLGTAQKTRLSDAYRRVR